jgi:hypothetical protein
LALDYETEVDSDLEQVFRRGDVSLSVERSSVMLGKLGEYFERLFPSW